MSAGMVVAEAKGAVLGEVGSDAVVEELYGAWAGLGFWR